MLNKRRSASMVVMRYVLLQVPALVLLILMLIVVGRWVDLPAWLAWGLVALWVVKDVVMFPFVRRAYETPSADSGPMIGEPGCARDRLAPSGYIRVRGELWQAEASEGDAPIEKGERVEVCGIRGLTLLVKPHENEDVQSEKRGASTNI